jgi:hypothetical protein
MPVMVGADLGHLCAAAVMGAVDCPADSGGSGRRRVRHAVRVTMGAVRRQHHRDQESGVIAVETGAGREAVLPVMHAGPSRIAECGDCGG